jgi:hypothetical protein
MSGLLAGVGEIDGAHIGDLTAGEVLSVEARAEDVGAGAPVRDPDA